MSDDGIVRVGTAKMIGFLLAICGNTLIACSLTLQKSAHNATSNNNPTHDEENNSDSQSLDASITRAHVLNAPDLDNDHDHLYDHHRYEPDDIELQLRLPPAVSQLYDNENTNAFQEKHSAYSYSGGIVVENDSSDSERSSSPSTHEPSGLAFLLHPIWWMGTFLMAAGEIGNFTAFAFAPASLVAPLGAWSVVLSAILAHVFLGESVSNGNLIGIALCVTGAFLIGTSGPDLSSVEADLDADAVFKLLVRLPFVIFMLIVLSATAALIFVSHRTSLGQRFIFIYVGVSSLLGAVTVVCAKALSSFLRITFEGNSQFGNWLPFVLGIVLACAILAQLRYLNMAMAQFGNAQVIPVYYVLFTTCAMASGIIMYREFDQLSIRNLPFFIGICATMSGVFFVSKSAQCGDIYPNEQKDTRQDRLDLSNGTSTLKKVITSSDPRPALNRIKRVRSQRACYERVLPVSPMSSPRSG